MSEVYLAKRSGRASLSFDVKAYASESVLPTTATENTVAIITSTAITGYVFTNSTPSNPKEGLVWITVGSGSPGEIDLTEKNNLSIYPMFAKQYVSGAWVQKIAKTFVDGVWESWLWTHVYNQGDICEALTGGWTTKAIGSDAQYNNPVAPTITYGSKYLQIRQGQDSSWQNGIAHTVNKIDLTPYSSISAVITSTSQGLAASTGYFILHDSFGTYGENGRVATSDYWQTNTGTFTIDTSNINKAVYVCFEAYWGITFRCSEIRLEV